MEQLNSSILDKYRVIFFVILCIFLSNSRADDADRSHSLFRLVESGNLQAFTNQLESGIDVNYISKDVDWNWAICEATKPGNEIFLKTSIRHGANLELRSESSSTPASSPLLCAISYNNLLAVKIMIMHGAKVDIDVCTDCASNPLKPVTFAALLNHFEIANYLFDRSINSEETLFELGRIIKLQPLSKNNEAFPWRELIVEKLGKKGFQILPNTIE